MTTEYIDMFVELEQEQVIELGAMIAGFVNVSDFMLNAALEKANVLIAEQEACE